MKGLSPSAAAVQHDSGLLAYQGVASFGAEDGFDQFQFPDFFDQIMNIPVHQVNGVPEPLLAPPNVSNYTSDDFGLMDFDFGLLASGLTRPPTPQGVGSHSNVPALAATSPQSDAQLRSEAFEKSPWSWGHWIPNKTHNTFSGQEINVTEQRVNANDQLTPSERPHSTYTLEVEARDRILRLVTSVAASRLSISSFPSLELMNDLLNVFVMQERHSIDSYIHWPSLDSRKMRTETLLGVIAKGATFVALPPVWKIGLVFQEITRLAIADVFEQDNSTTRQLQPLQAYLLYLDVGLWSGFRRKTEIASSFLQPGATMLAWSDALTKFRYSDIEANAEDDMSANEMKWKAWLEQESLKRLVLHTFIHDSQASLAHTKTPLLTPSQMQLPLPLSLALWQAHDAESWRSCYLSRTRMQQSKMPSVVAIGADFQILQRYGDSIDERLCTLLACHLIAYDVIQNRQQAAVFASRSDSSRTGRWLAHTNRQKEIYEDLNAIHTYYEMMAQPLHEALFLLQYLMMLLHTSFDDIQLFSGRSGESEARRVYPLIKAWTESAESRTAVWHAGQALRAARLFEKTKLRDVYAVILNHATLVLWVYGMVTGNLARMSRGASPAREGMQQLAFSRNNIRPGQDNDVLLDAEDGRQAKAFRHFGQGRPCLSRVESGQLLRGKAEVCPLEHPKGIMLLASQVLKDNFPNSSSGLPALVDNLVKLMTELSRFSGKDGG